MTTRIIRLFAHEIIHTEASKGEKRMKICCCFALKAPTGLSWPGIGQDYEERKAYYRHLLEENFGEDNTFVYEDHTAQATDEELRAMTQYDGFLMILLAHGTALAQRMAGMLKHGLLIDDPYGGSGDIIRVANLIHSHQYPLTAVGTQDTQALLHRIRVYLAIPRIQHSRILVFKNFEKMSPDKEAEMKRSIGTGSTMKRYLAGQEGFQRDVDRIRETFGIEVVMKTLAELNAYQQSVREEDARVYAEKWAREAKQMVEPSYADLLSSARMYLALEKAKADAHADVISVDCILMFFAYNMSVYPCMSFFEMNNHGQIGVCEGDLDSCVTSLIIREVTGRPGFVSDPFVDTEANRIVYAHCVASNRPFGTDGGVYPYCIRTHGEDHASAAIQALLPPDYPLTTIKVSTAGKAMSIHSGTSAGNIDHECGCRTKLVCQVPNSRLIMDNWHDELFSWHRVTVYGNYREDFTEVCRYLGLALYQEDRENAGRP